MTLSRYHCRSGKCGPVLVTHIYSSWRQRGGSGRKKSEEKKSNWPRHFLFLIQLHDAHGSPEDIFLKLERIYNHKATSPPCCAWSSWMYWLTSRDIYIQINWIASWIAPSQDIIKFAKIFILILSTIVTRIAVKVRVSGYQY